MDHTWGGPQKSASQRIVLRFTKVVRLSGYTHKVKISTNKLTRFQKKKKKKLNTFEEFDLKKKDGEEIKSVFALVLWFAQ
ncbi:MAG: hypothetical protein O7D30_01060 [Rickettsia endosymbiont of Ixodes persulcatus]|nr:hypothetical protein [Rickettsia endosymbiont of Ixodes persulcatus]